MKINNLTIILLLTTMTWFCMAFVCQKDRESDQIRRDSSSVQARKASGSTRTDSINLPGTEWDLISMTEKGHPVEELQTTPNVEFCTSGKWAKLNYSSIEGGSYRVSGNHLTMKDENGGLYAEGTITYKDGILELDAPEYTYRFKYLEQTDCR